ncbi:uncharacterized protein E0L32_011718 [Thyridium curvatum]|uniref:Uncharacterized protein n=1 Tax=Thyridium curvatum TaxID=1093900 RepID=A0A507B5J3_9PEZI|nr:uncharacterized protein E0L32_011718 [Thyridium curvatum]TPX18385.1 hypothetical protein E0L32_011718 [Thyridium curvatum]
MEPEASEATGNSDISIEKIQGLLKTKNDTSRFVGLALLKSVLDNSKELREDEAALSELWGCISPKFLDRLLRTGSAPSHSQKDAKDMLDLAVAVVHTFTILLPESKRSEQKLVGRIPLLVASLVDSSAETTDLILQTITTLVSQPEGAAVLNKIDDLSPLTEIAPSHKLALDILSFSWLNAMANGEDMAGMRSKIDQTIQSLVATFKGTDGVTLLEFLAQVLSDLDSQLIPQNPKWLAQVVAFIRSLVISRPTPAGRAAYTNLAAALLQLYPIAAPTLLFSDSSRTSAPRSPDAKPFSYLLVNLMLIDLRSSLPSLLEKLNSPEYPSTSRRLASAFDTLSAFIGYLVRAATIDDGDSSSSSALSGMPPPDLLLKLRKSISETISLTIEHLRDRYDAAVAGAPGLHPSARAGGAGASPSLTWDSKTTPSSAAADPFVLSAVRATALWLREDDNDTLRREAAGGLTDMLLDLYRASCRATPPPALDFRRPALVALEGMTAAPGAEDDDPDDGGVAALLGHDGWSVLTRDMLSILEDAPTVAAAAAAEGEAARGIEIVRVLMPIVEAEQPGTREEWMDLVTLVAGWHVPDDVAGAGSSHGQPTVLLDFYVAVLQLVTALLVRAHEGMRRRYVQSISAVLGIAAQLRARVDAVGERGLSESLEDVLVTLDPLR